MRIHINYIWHETHWGKTIKPIYMTWHSSCLCLGDHTHCIDDITYTVLMTSHLLYIWKNMYCIWHLTHDLWHHNTHDIKAIICHLTPVISDSTSTVSLSSHPDYRSLNPHCMYDNTATICMTSYELPMTSHPLFMISHHAMTSHPLYSCHHTQDTCHCIFCSSTITYSVLTIPHLLYMWHETHYMHTSQEFYMTSHSLFIT